MKKEILVVGVLLLLAGAGCSFASNTKTQENKPLMPEQTKDVMMEGATNTDANMIDDTKGSGKKEGELMMGATSSAKNTMEDKKMENKKMEAGTYEAYAPEKIAFASEGNVVLFFHAPWCPTCRALDASINASLSNIPQNTKILKVDYDSSADLKKKYGVTYQHTLVQVDADGNRIKKWSGGETLATITTQIQ